MRPAFEQTLGDLAADGEIVSLERIAARSPRYRAPTDGVDPALAERLGVCTESLWTHQADAIDLIRRRQSVVIATGTASGKSVCYQLPIAEAALTRGARSTSLLMFPTKALAQDQLRSLSALHIPGLVAAAYDGDSDADARAWTRRHATVVLSNPDMVHAGILPYHARWASFLRRLEHIVVDELHVYRGVFGTHVAHVLRRLRRICRHYGSNPTFIFASATIGGPAELATELCGQAVTCIDDDGAPVGERLLAVWRPPVSRNGAPVSGNAATAHLLGGLASAGHRTIAFTRSRRGTEVVASRARNSVDPSISSRIRSYRGGYLPHERREIEAQLFSGALLGIAATSALELGIDIGGLDACIVNGFPGTVSSFRQQIGRAGRSSQRSLAVLVAGDDALDQWFADHPDELLQRQPERCVVNITNPFVLRPHVACAAHELPLTRGDVGMWTACGDDSFSADALDEGVRDLVLDDTLVLVNGRAVYAGRGSPANQVGLRSGSSDEVRIVDSRTSRLLGTVDGERATSAVHRGALYLHQGQQYRVVQLDLEDRAAWVQAVEVDEYTQVRSVTDVRILKVSDHAMVGRLPLRVGAVEVTEHVVGFQRKRISTGTTIGYDDLDTPPSRLVTRAFWYEVPDEVLIAAGLCDADAAFVPGTVHAAEHAGIGMLPLFTICDRWDVGGVSSARHEQTGSAIIVIYDAYPGGAGIAELGFRSGPRHLAATLAAIRRCTCATGCPSCVQSPKCGNGNDPLEKAWAVQLLDTAINARCHGSRSPSGS